jgi:SH3 domain-containing protein
MKKLAFATMLSAALLGGSLVVSAGAALADTGVAVMQRDAAVVVQPGVGAKAGALNAGTEVAVIDVNGEWTHIQTASGLDGWVPSIALRPAP